MFIFLNQALQLQVRLHAQILLALYTDMSGIVAASCTHPLDLARVYVPVPLHSLKLLICTLFSRRMQTIQVAPGGRTPNTFSVIYQSVVKNGFRSLYAGLSASLLRQMSYSMVRLGAYENLKGRLSKDGTPSTTNLILAAAFAGALGGIAGNPAGTHVLYSLGRNALNIKFIRHFDGQNDFRRD